MQKNKLIVDNYLFSVKRFISILEIVTWINNKIRWINGIILLRSENLHPRTSTIRFDRPNKILKFIETLPIPWKHTCFKKVIFNVFE